MDEHPEMGTNLDRIANKRIDNVHDNASPVNENTPSYMSFTEDGDPLITED